VGDGCCRYGFETSVSHMIHRTQGVQLSDKGDDGKNVFQPTRCVCVKQASQTLLRDTRPCNVTRDLQHVMQPCKLTLPLAAAGQRRKRSARANWEGRDRERRRARLWGVLLQ